MNDLIQQVLHANLELPRYGLVIFTWGNASGIDRQKGLVVIKPSGVPYEGMNETHMVIVDLDGNIISGEYKPSSDTATHLEIYRNFPEVGGIVHCHSKWATAWAESGLDMPAYGTTQADYFYGTVPCTRKLTKDEIVNDYELNTGKVIVETFHNRNLSPVAVPGIFVAGHAPFCWGKSPEDAVHSSVVLEQCAMMAIHAATINPALKPISQDLLDKHHFRKHGVNAYYGQ